MTTLPEPAFFDPSHAGDWDHRPDVDAVLAAARALRPAVTPAGGDRERVLLLVIDAQKDFCHPDGALYVGGRDGRGAIRDSVRLCRFIHRHGHRITSIDCTLDTHLPHHIFFPDFWCNGDGESPAAHTEILAEQVEAGDWVPRPDLAGVVCDGDADWLRRQAADYCRRLEAEGRYRLYLWPPHCLAGGDGHALLGILQEARLYHAALRSAESRLEWKGTHPLTENYSVLSPEVLVAHDGTPLARPNDAYLERLLTADRLIVAGQAASHCVRFTLDHLLQRLGDARGEVADRIVVLEDCMSAVAVPDGSGGFVADFTDAVAERMEAYRAAGLRVCSSDDTDAVFGG